MYLLTRLTQRFRAAKPEKHFLLAACLLSAQPAMPISLAKNTVEFEIQFSSESSMLTELAAQDLSDQLPCVKALFLEVAFVRTFGDSAPSTLDGITQMNLAAARANTLRSALRDLGFSDTRIYTQAEGIVTEGTAGTQAINPPGGTAKIEYVGTCRAGAAGKPECDRLCNAKR